MRIMTTKRDLRNWVAEHLHDDDATEPNIDAVTDRIARDMSAPNWGRDWSEYLDTLDLRDILTRLGL